MKRGFVEILRKQGYQVETKKLGGGYVNDVKLVTARRGNEIAEYVLKKYSSTTDMNSMMRGYDKISRVVKTPTIVYFNIDDKEVAYDLVKGKSVKDLISKKDPRARKAVAQLADDLQRLHLAEEHEPNYKRDDSPDERKIRKNALKVHAKGSITRDHLQSIQRLIAKHIPKNKRIIHGDAHLGNFLYTDNGELYIIDTDDVKLSDYHADLGKVVESIEELKSSGRINGDECNELRGLFLEAYRGEEADSVTLHQLRTPLIASKTSKHPRGPFRVRILLEKLRGVSALETKVAGLVILGLSMGILLLSGLNLTGNSVSELDSTSNLPFTMASIGVIAITVIYLVAKFSRKKADRKKR